jgi:hypothetical protein
MWCHLMDHRVLYSGQPGGHQLFSWNAASAIVETRSARMLRAGCHLIPPPGDAEFHSYSFFLPFHHTSWISPDFWLGRTEDVPTAGPISVEKRHVFFLGFILLLEYHCTYEELVGVQKVVIALHDASCGRRRRNFLLPSTHHHYQHTYACNASSLSPALPHRTPEKPPEHC